MPVKRLETLCVRTIVSAIWCVSNVQEEICKLAYEVAHMEKKPGYTQVEMLEHFGKFWQTPYYKLTESILNKIMKIEIESKLNLKIAMEFFHLEHNFRDAMLELTGRLKEKSMHNIKYCVAKAVLQNNEVNRCETIYQIYFHSFFEVLFHTKNIEEICCLRKGNFYELFDHLRASHRLANRRKTWQSVFEMITGLESVYFVWLEDATRVFGNVLNETYIPCPKILLDHVTINAPLEILDYFYDMTRGQKDSEEMATRALVSTLTYHRSNNDNILYLFKDISKQSQLTIFKRFYEEILSKLYNSCYIDFCVEVFTELCENKEFTTCMNILYQAVDIFTSSSSASDLYSDFFSAIGKERFLNMWKTVPDSVKVELGKKFYQMLDLLIRYDCYDVVSPLISDKVYDSQQKSEFNIYVLSKTSLYSGCSLKDLMMSCPELNMSCIKDNMNCDLLKKMLLKRNDYDYDYESFSVFFESKSSEIEFKRQLLNDKTFVVDMLSIIAPTEYGEAEMVCFLNWIYENDEEAAQKFIEKYLVSEHWLVDIYKKYLLEITTQGENPDSTKFGQLNMSKEQEDEIKALVREDIDLLHKLCANFTGPNLYDVTILLEYLYNNALENEKQQLLEHYLLSDQGLTRIYQLFEPEHYSERMYFSYGFYPSVSLYFKFLRFWLYGNPGLQTALNNALDRLGHPNSIKSVNNCEPKFDLLPFESIHQHRMIVDANYRLFRSIIKIESNNYHKAYTNNEDFKDCRRISSLTAYSQKFAMKWAGLNIPVVL